MYISLLSRISSKLFSITVTSSLILLSNTIIAEAKPIKISNATTFDFKGCVKSSDGNDIICVGNFRNRDADKQITIYREGYFSSNDVSITDFNGKSYKADEIKVGNGKSCRTGCSSLELTLVEGVDYQTYFIFKDVSLPSSQIALLQMKLSGAEEIKIRKISLSRQTSSSSEAVDENNNTALKPIEIPPQSPEEMLKTYFATVLSRDYKKAWSMISSNAQSDTSVHPNGYTSFTEQSKKTGNFDVKSVKLVSQNNQEAIVNVDINLRSRILRFQYTLRKEMGNGNWMIFKGKYR
jgi:hypothetical protein